MASIFRLVADVKTNNIGYVISVTNDAILPTYLFIA